MNSTDATNTYYTKTYLDTTFTNYYNKTYIDNNLNLKSNSESPTFTGTITFDALSVVNGLTKSTVGLANVDNTTDLNKPVSTATQTALNLKANLASPTFTGTVSGITKSMVGLTNVDNTTDLNKPVSTATQTALDLKANLASPTFTGTVSGITKSMVGLANVDNTTDLNKPVSTATQTALNLKANLASPVFTGTVSGITKSMVGLANVDNTTDLNKPVSTATQTALNLKSNINNPQFTNNVGINVAADSALHIVGSRITSPNSVGIRMGSTTESFPSSATSYGIEICSNDNAGSTIDFTYPYGAASSYYAGRIFFENWEGYMAFNCNYYPSTSELISTPQMTLERYGNLTLQNQLIVPYINLNNNDLQTMINNKLDSSSITDYYTKTECNNLLNQKQALIAGTSIYQATYGLVNALMISHIQGIQFSITGFIPAPSSSVQLTIDDLGLSAKNLSLSQNITVEGVATINGNTNTKNIIADGNITMGTFGIDNKLKFNTSNNDYNYILVDAYNKMFFNANNINHIKLDTATYVNTDLTLTTATANVNRTILVENTYASSGSAYLTLKSRNAAVSGSIFASSGFYICTDANVSMRFHINRLGTNKQAMVINTDGSVTMYFAPLTVNGTGYTSDKQLKYDVEDLNLHDCLNIFNNINSKSFKWKNNNKNSIGFIANEVEETIKNNILFGDLVNESDYQPDENIESIKIKTLDYSRMCCILWSVVKLQQQKLNDLETRILLLEQKLSKLI